jgi:nifR3 family TIM-barrel protein
MGCPVKKVVRTGAGAALMKNPALAFEIMKAVRRATALPLTVKIRSGWSDRTVNAPELARLAAEAGLDAVIVHPRTVAQGFGGRADWRIIADVKRELTIPVVGNGDIRTPADAARMRAETGCDGVMVGRGALGNPWIFQGIADAGAAREDGWPDAAERERVLRRHWAAEAAYAGPAVAARTFRKHLLWYTKGLKGGAAFRQAAGRLTDETALLAELDRFFSTLAPGEGGQAIKA